MKYRTVLVYYARPTGDNVGVHWVYIVKGRVCRVQGTLICITMSVYIVKSRVCRVQGTLICITMSVYIVKGRV